MFRSWSSHSLTYFIPCPSSTSSASLTPSSYSRDSPPKKFSAGLQPVGRSASPLAIGSADYINISCFNYMLLALCYIAATALLLLSLTTFHLIFYDAFSSLPGPQQQALPSASPPSSPPPSTPPPSTPPPSSSPVMGSSLPVPLFSSSSSSEVS